jgi:hypothetical protein
MVLRFAHSKNTPHNQSPGPNAVSSCRRSRLGAAWVGAQADARIVTLVLLMTFCFFNGCTGRSLVKKNTDSIKTIGTAIYLYDDMEFSPNGFPSTLDELVVKGLLKEIPKCQCADGKFRDFIYISGFKYRVSDHVILASPPEMDPEVSIVYYGGEVKLLPSSEAQKEINKSRDFVKSISNK